MGDAFAIVRMDDSEVDLAQIARLIAEPLEVEVADLVQTLAHRFGILAEDVSEAVASRCVVALQEVGVSVRAVPQSAIVEPPEPLQLRSGRPDDDVFFYVGPTTQKGVVKWADVVWADLASVQEASQQKYEDWELSGRSDGTATRRVRTHRTVVTRQPPFLELVWREPWLVLRISPERFEFTTTGLPLFATARENLLALAGTIASRATAAHLGPGLSWLGTDSPPREHRAQTEATYLGFLRWQLTRYALD
jgi:hypothetical protein